MAAGSEGSGGGGVRPELWGHTLRVTLSDSGGNVLDVTPALVQAVGLDGNPLVTIRIDKVKDLLHGAEAEGFGMRSGAFSPARRAGKTSKLRDAAIENALSEAQERQEVERLTEEFKRRRARRAA